VTQAVAAPSLAAGGGAVSSGNGAASAQAVPVGPKRPRRAAPRESHDAFPYTRRPLPWLLAGFLALLFFVPVASIEFDIHLPVDSRPDRFAIIILILAWMWFGGDQRAFLRTRRSKLFVTAACIFLVLAVASLLLDAGRIVNIGDFKLAEKRFALLGSFFVLCWFTMTALRFEDVRGFATYLIGLGSVMSIGMLIERRTGYNVFYEWSRAILSPIAKVAASPTGIHPTFGTEDRVSVVGPTNHGLAATTMLALVMPFALVRVFDAKTRRSWWLNGIAFALMLGAAMATDRKTALLVPAAMVIYLTFYRPRAVLRLAPLGLVLLLGVVHFAAPGAIGHLLNVEAETNSTSTTHRASDFTDVTPDVLAHPILGRGYGTLNPEEPEQFRINDDEYLDEIWEVGAVGLLAFAWMILSPVVAARKAIRTRAPAISSLALAASSGCVAFFVVCALFDALSFPQAPYMFFVVAALATVAAAGPEGNVTPSRELVRSLSGTQRAALA
jgi:hypothetical protein